MRIGNGPRLVVPRPGQPGRRGWYGQWRDRGQAYDLWREQERERIAKQLPLWHERLGDTKRIAHQLGSLKAGERFRLVDSHGRSYGPRLTAPSDLPDTTRVRRVCPQPEDFRSQLSRMLKRAHKLAMRDY